MYIFSISDFISQVKNSKRIAVIGGGPVGVEIACELKTDYPDKTVTIFHPNEDLLRTGLSDKFKKKLRGMLDRLKVDLMLGMSLIKIVIFIG